VPWVRGCRPQDLIAGISQTDALVILSPTELTAASIDAGLWSSFQFIVDGYAPTAKLRAGLPAQDGLRRLHLLRHHLVIDGQPSPLSESAVNALPLADQHALARRIDELAAAHPGRGGKLRLAVACVTLGIGDGCGELPPDGGSGLGG